MALIEIRDVLDNETGKTIFPRTHVDAVIGLKDFSFFEKVQDANDPTKFSIKLKSEYTGLWAEGFVSAGGVGSQSGGGGLISSVKGVADLGTPIATESLTETFSAKAIESIFERVVALENATPQIDLSDYGTSLSLTKTTNASFLKDANGNFFLDANGNKVAVGGQYSETSYLNLLNNVGDVLSSVELDLDFSSYATRSWVSQNFLTQETDPTVPAWAKALEKPSYSFSEINSLPTTLSGYGITDAALATDLTALGVRVTSIEDWFEVVTVNGQSALHAKNGRAFYSDSWIAAGGVGSQSSGGWSITVDSALSPTSENPVQNKAIYTALSGKQDALIASGAAQNIKTINGESILGIGDITISGGDSVEVSNLLSAGTRVATIRIGGAGGTSYDILAPTSGGSGSGEVDPVFSASAAYGLTAADVTAIRTIGDLALKTGAWNYNFQVYSLIFLGGSLTGPNVVTGEHRLRYTYTEGGASVDDPSTTVVKTLAYLDDIPAHQTVTLTGGTNNGTLKLTTAAGTVDNIAVTGLQALAYKASLVASDIPDISGTYVTVATAQTVTGLKTLSAGLVTGGDIYPSTDLGGSLGYSNRRFANANIQTIGTSTIYLKNSNSGNSGLISASGGYLVVRAGADLNTSYKQLTFHESYGFYPDGTGVNLGYSGSTNRWQTIYGVNGDLTGDLSLASTSHIDIGPLRIEYDATNKALHITKKDSNDTETYGLYADGFIAAGGVQQSA